MLELCPRGSILERAVQLTLTNSDLPPSLTFFSLATHLGAALTQQGFCIQPTTGVNIHPNIWLYCLAESGTGKSWATNNIVSEIIAPCEITRIPHTFTAAALFEFLCTTGLQHSEASKLSDEDVTALVQRRCRGLLVRDEFAELMKRINGNESAGEIKDLLLRLYDGKPLHRATKYEGEKKTQPVAVSLYGSAVDETFFRSVKEEDFSNGLMQRFLVVLAHDRPAHRKSLYTLDGMREAATHFASMWREALDGPRQYVVTRQALDLFNEWFHETNCRDQSRESFVRRYVFSAWKYALILKAITEPNGSVGVSTLEIAIRIVERHLCDLHTALTNYTAITEWHVVYQKVARYLHANPSATRKHLLTQIRGVGPSKNLDVILETLAEAHFEEPIGTLASQLFRKSRTS